MDDSFDDTKDKLRQFSYYKQLILNDKTGGRNIIIEEKNGEHKIIPTIYLTDKYNCDWSKIERITIFKKCISKDLKITFEEYEFMACQ